MCCRSRKSALASLNSGNRHAALRHMRAFKLANENREKCESLLNRVEEVLNVIANAESTKKVIQHRPQCLVLFLLLLLFFCITGLAIECHINCSFELL